MADLTKNLLVKLTGDSKSAQTAMLEFDAAVAKSQQATANLAVKVEEDFRKMQVAAAQAAESIKAIDTVGAGGGGFSGEGLVGGLAAALPGIALGVEQFGLSSVRAFGQAADSVRLFSQLTGASAEESSKWINAGQLMGVSADTMTTAFGKFGSTVEANKAQLQDHGVVLAHNADGSINLTKSIGSIQDAFQATTSATERDTIAKLAAGRGYKELESILNLTKDQMNNLLDAASKGPIFNNDDLTRAQEMKVKLGEIQLAVDNLKVQAGGRILGDLSGAVSGLQRIDDLLHDMDGIVPHFASGFGQVLKGLAESAPVLGPIVGFFDAAKAGEQGLHNLGDSAHYADVGMGAMRGAADSVTYSLDDVGKQATITEGNIISMATSMRQAQSAWSQFQTASDYSSNASDKFTKALDALDTAQTKASSSMSNYADAQEAGAQRIADSQQRIVDAKQRVVDAEQNLAEVTESAEQRVADAQESASRSAESAAQKVEDAKQRLADAINASLRDSNPYTANRTVEDARQALSRAEADQTRTLGDSAKSVAKAREEADKQVADAKKGIVTATKDEQKAEQDLDKTLRDVEKSMRSAGAAADGANQSLSTQQGLIDGVVKATGDKIFAQALDKDSLDHINETVQTAQTRIREQGAAWGWSKDKVDEYIAKIGEIPKNVTTVLGLTVDLYGFERQVDAAMQFFANPNDSLTRAGVENAMAGSQGGIIQADTGGVVPGPLGDPVRAIVHGGEVILNSEQQQAIRGAIGGGLTVNVYPQNVVGSVSDLIEQIRQALDKGYAGIRG